MAARYSYSPYEVDPLGQYQYQQSGPRRVASAIGRFFYRLIVLTLILGAVGGVLFALYRNDILLTIARGAGVEAQYRSLEQRIGVPGWGTPRSIELPKNMPEAAPVATSPTPAAAEPKDTGSKAPETVTAAATSETKSAKTDAPAVASFDSLPALPSKGAAPQAVSLSSLPAAEPAKPAKSSRAEPAPARAPQRTARNARAEKPEPAKPTEVTRSIPLPKAPPKPEPVAKAEPAPKPEPPAPKPVPEDHTKPRTSDNPLQAAIRASMAAKGKSSE